MPDSNVKMKVAVAQNPLLEEARNRFIDGAGLIAVSLLGMLNRLCGQIYALLFLSREPLSLDDIVEKLQVSKGSVSIHIRILEDYKLVRRILVRGSRRDYYEAVTALPQKIIREFFDKIRRNIHDSLDMISDCNELTAKAKSQSKSGSNTLAKEEIDFTLERLQLVESFYQSANLLFDAIYAGQPIDTSLLNPILQSPKP